MNKFSRCAGQHQKAAFFSLLCTATLLQTSKAWAHGMSADHQRNPKDVHHSNPEGFGFNEDGHFHAHQRMTAETQA